MMCSSLLHLDFAGLPQAFISSWQTGWGQLVLDDLIHTLDMSAERVGIGRVAGLLFSCELSLHSGYQTCQLLWDRLQPKTTSSVSLLSLAKVASLRNVRAVNAKALTAPSLLLTSLITSVFVTLFK